MSTKTSKVHLTLCLVFLFTYFSALFYMGNGDICTENLGGCDPQCDSRCATKHPGGQSACDAATSMCKCFYQCGGPAVPPPPEGKRCTSGYGYCDIKCGEECCNKACADRYAGNLDGRGYCYRPIAYPYYVCMCTYVCDR